MWQAFFFYNVNVDRLLLALLIVGGCGVFGGVVAGAITGGEPTYRSQLLPLPHQIAKDPDGISFRFAMIHDVVHDRYARHGAAYYRERNRQVLAAIEMIRDTDGLPPFDQFHLLDDLGVGLDSVGAHDDAVRWLRRKLDAERKRGLQGKSLYRTYANLGTFLVHGNMPLALGRDPKAKELVQEGLRYINQAIEANPQAHFGREIWQAEAIEFMLMASENPTSLLERDLVGNLLDDEFGLESQLNKRGAVRWYRRKETCRRVRDFLRDPNDNKTRDQLRGYITILRIGKQIPFDEPCLGIIGMWRLGGGANPHFALALGEIMCRVNQRSLAWAAYERAVRESARFSPHAEIRTKLVEHCRKRQKSLVAALQADETDLRGKFDAELQIGQQYQLAYQKFEEDRIAKGRTLNDPKFYDEFNSNHGEIATPTGTADFLETKEIQMPETYGSYALGGGMGAAVGAVGFVIYARRRKTGT